MNTFFQSYLYAWVFWTGLTVGCFGLTLLYHATKARWARPVLRIWEAGSKNLVIMLIAFIPIAIALLQHQLYPWADPAIWQENHVVLHKRPWLNEPFFIGRTVIYFLIWIGLSSLLNKSSRRQDETGDVNE